MAMYSGYETVDMILAISVMGLAVICNLILMVSVLLSRQKKKIMWTFFAYSFLAALLSSVCLAHLIMSAVRGSVVGGEAGCLRFQASLQLINCACALLNITYISIIRYASNVKKYSFSLWTSLLGFVLIFVGNVATVLIVAFLDKTIAYDEHGIFCGGGSNLYLYILAMHLIALFVILICYSLLQRHAMDVIVMLNSLPHGVRAGRVLELNKTIMIAVGAYFSCAAVYLAGSTWWYFANPDDGPYQSRTVGRVFFYCVVAYHLHFTVCPLLVLYFVPELRSVFGSRGFIVSRASEFVPSKQTRGGTAYSVKDTEPVTLQRPRDSVTRTSRVAPAPHDTLTLGTSSHVRGSVGGLIQIKAG